MFAKKHARAPLASPHQSLSLFFHFSILLIERSALQSTSLINQPNHHVLLFLHRPVNAATPGLPFLASEVAAASSRTNRMTEALHRQDSVV
jgi:uncharacterized protein VirK/YbjX